MSGKPPDTFRENVLLDPHFPIYKHLNGVFFSDKISNVNTN